LESACRCLSLEVYVGAGVPHRGREVYMPEPLTDCRELDPELQQMNRRGARRVDEWADPVPEIDIRTEQ
jgi:hypothetical protein